MSSLGGNLVSIDKPKFVDASVVAYHLGYKRGTILLLARTKKIPAHRVKNGVRTHWRFDLDEVLRSLEVA